LKHSLPESDIPKACRERLEKEYALFQADYQKYHVQGETKPSDIGSPFLLHHPGSQNAVLLIHGFMAAPYEVRQWADDLFSKGYTVFAPRLSGHGTSAMDLATRNYTDWRESVERGYEILASCANRIIVAGFSTGAGLALDQAIRHPDRYHSVISVSAPMKFKHLSSTFSETIERWNMIFKALKLSSFQKQFAKNHPDNPDINYHRCPIHGFNQVKALMRNVYQGLPGLSIPALIIQGNQDPKVSPEAGKLIFDRIRIRKKTMVEISHHQHGIVRGQVGASVFSRVHDFLSQVVTAA
jgi:carboxylesterase